MPWIDWPPKMKRGPCIDMRLKGAMICRYVVRVLLRNDGLKN